MWRLVVVVGLLQFAPMNLWFACAWGEPGGHKVTSVYLLSLHAVDLTNGEGINGKEGKEGDIDVVRYGVIQFCGRRESHRCSHWDSPDVVIIVSTAVSSISRLSPDSGLSMVRLPLSKYEYVLETGGRMSRGACRTTAPLAATGVV